MSYLTEAAPASTGGALETFEAPQLTVAAGSAGGAVAAHQAQLPPGYEYASLPHTRTIDLIGEEFVKKDSIASMPNVVVVSGNFKRDIRSRKY